MSILLDTEEERNKIIQECGAKPLGESPSTKDGENTMSRFLDPITGSTCVLPIEDVSRDSVTKKLAEKRNQFGLSLTEPASASLGYAKLREQLLCAIKAAIGERVLPEEIMRDAADAATRKILAFEVAPENFHSQVSEFKSPSECEA